MKVFDKAVIIGTGLIGGSLGKALKDRRMVSCIYGLSRNRRNAVTAKKTGAIDQIGESLDVVKEADLVVLATPVDTILGIAAKIAKKVKKGCVVIDVGSTKEEIVNEAGRLIPNFIGCHPLSGSEKRGIANIRKDIFKGAVCIITPAPGTKKDALSRVSALWKGLGSSVVRLSPPEHDRVVAFTSHMPHAVAFALISSVPDRFLSLGAGGLKDSTRISASDAGLWASIFLSNRANILSSLSVFQDKLAFLKLALRKKDGKLLKKFLSRASVKRGKLDDHSY
ncbi:MAG: prephenate dehydrogenase [Candidatus Omnitrophota bacterium]